MSARSMKSRHGPGSGWGFDCDVRGGIHFLRYPFGRRRSFDELLGKCANARCENLIHLRPVIPIADRPIAVAKQEVAFEICTDDADLLSSPPRGFKRSPVILPDQTGNHNVRVAARKSPSQVQLAPGRFDGIGWWVHSRSLLCSVRTGVLSRLE